VFTNFQNSFTDRLIGKFATNSYLNITPHLKYIAKYVLWLMINYKVPQPSILVVMHYFTTNFIYHPGSPGQRAVKRVYVCCLMFFKSVNLRRSYRQNDWLCHMPHLPQKVCTKRCRTRQISEITCVWRPKTVTNCCCVNRQVNVSLLSTNIILL